MTTTEHQRLDSDAQRQTNWKRWGPYLSERQWGTVREDYSPAGDAWRYFSHDHARSRAYRWGEDGLLGFTDRQCRLCFSLALWNHRDPFLKERLFGLTGLPEGNHGEDVKECYYYLDSTPTHSWCTALYKYPQARFPYEDLVAENRRRGLQSPEYELADTGIFDGNRYWDITVEYAKASPDDILILVKAVNHGPEEAALDLLPTLWFRNTWVWGCAHEGCTLKPAIWLDTPHRVATRHDSLAPFYFEADPCEGDFEWLFTENETNSRLLFGAENSAPFTKDAFHRYVVDGEKGAVNPGLRGTKVAAWSRHRVPPGGTLMRSYRLRAAMPDAPPAFGAEFFGTREQRRCEAVEFHQSVEPAACDDDTRNIIRQAHAGLLWSKQFYHLIVEDWLRGDPAQPSPAPERLQGRNHEWGHFFSRDVISMPDKWEYPWFAAWDLAFHMIPFAKLDPHFAKQQLILFLREWYMHPNGQIPAYEWALGDVNPPVHAWAAWRVYQITGANDRVFLESVFQKLLLNFTWWVNRKDAEGKNLFGGGFLGLDNIGIFDRSQALPTGGSLQQADGTAWMAFYAGTMLAMALELAPENPAYEDMASKFFEHFVQIATAINTLGGTGLWDEEDGFYYDLLKANGGQTRLKTRSMVGLLPMIAAEVLVDDKLRKLKGFYKRFEWFLHHRTDLPCIQTASGTGRCAITGQTYRLLAITDRAKLERMIKYLLDETEFLSPHGIRSLSRHHRDHPFLLHASGREYRVSYVPGEGDSHLFGGNSNWRGPVWFPINFLLVEALGRYCQFYGDSFRVELPTGSGKWVSLHEAEQEITRRLGAIFQRQPDGTRACHGGDSRYASDPAWKDLLLFHEYFHGDSGRGLGATHQTGWTALAATLLASLHQKTGTSQ